MSMIIHLILIYRETVVTGNAPDFCQEHFPCGIGGISIDELLKKRIVEQCYMYIIMTFQNLAVWGVV